MGIYINCQKQLKEDLKRKREETMYQLKRQGDDRQKLEQEIFTAGCKLRTIMEENQKLEDVCKLSDVKKGELTLYYSAVQELVLGGGGNSNKQNYNLLLHSIIHAWLDWFGIIKGCQKLAEEILDLRKQMEEDAGLKEKLDEELEAVKGKFVFSKSNKYICLFNKQMFVCLFVCLKYKYWKPYAFSVIILIVKTVGLFNIA